MSRLKFVKQRLAVAVLLTLVSLEVFVVRFLCTYDGFMTPRQFWIGTTTATSINLLFAFFLRFALPVGTWQIPFWTACGMWLAWYNPAPERMHYWMTMECLHVGMTVSEVEKVVKPSPMQKDEWGQPKWYFKPANQTHWYISGHTGSSRYRRYDETYITTENGKVAEIRSYLDD